VHWRIAVSLKAKRRKEEGSVVKINSKSKKELKETIHFDLNKLLAPVSIMSGLESAGKCDTNEHYLLYYDRLPPMYHFPSPLGGSVLLIINGPFIRKQPKK
jgi:hypothetical protein